MCQIFWCTAFLGQLQSHSDRSPSPTIVAASALSGTTTMASKGVGDGELGREVGSGSKGSDTDDDDADVDDDNRFCCFCFWSSSFCFDVAEMTKYPRQRPVSGSSGSRDSQSSVTVA